MNTLNSMDFDAIDSMDIEQEQEVSEVRTELEYISYTPWSVGNRIRGSSDLSRK